MFSPHFSHSFDFESRCSPFSLNWQESSLASAAVIYYFLQGSLNQWRIVFWMTASIYAFGAVFYIIFASAEEQPWASIKPALPSGTKYNELKVIEGMRCAAFCGIEVALVENGAKVFTNCVLRLTKRTVNSHRNRRHAQSQQCWCEGLSLCVYREKSTTPGFYLNGTGLGDTKTSLGTGKVVPYLHTPTMYMSNSTHHHRAPLQVRFTVAKPSNIVYPFSQKSKSIINNNNLTSHYSL